MVAGSSSKDTWAGVFARHLSLVRRSISTASDAFDPGWEFNLCFQAARYLAILRSRRVAVVVFCAVIASHALFNCWAKAESDARCADRSSGSKKCEETKGKTMHLILP